MGDIWIQNTARYLIKYASQILTETPCLLDKVAEFLYASGEVTSSSTAINDIIAFSEKFPSVIILEREPVVGYFMIFYHLDALMTFEGTNTLSAELPSLESTDNKLSSSKKPLTSLIELSNEICALTNDKTALERIAIENVKSDISEIPNTMICDSHSYKECMKAGRKGCENKIHLERILPAGGEMSDCSYLDTCFKGRQCKYVHYRTKFPKNATHYHLAESKAPSQFINANLLELDLGLLGSDYKVLIIDPPWDIHTKSGGQGCCDSDFSNLAIDKLQESGIVFLWVTGRVLDLGRQCLSKWGYNHIEEVIWLKTNQLGKTICTGRTGHWLNHTKEHVLVGVKGNSELGVRQMIDADVIVSTALGKSQKPEELYGIIDRIVGTDAKKLELFGRRTNIRPGWLTIGNEMGSTSVTDPQLKRKLKLSRH